MSLPEALDRLRSRADGHDTPFTVLDADTVLMEITRLRALERANQPDALTEIRKTLQDAIDERDAAWAGRIKATGDELHHLAGAAELAEWVLPNLFADSDRADDGPQHATIDRLELRAGDGSRLVCTSDPSGRVHLSVAQCPDRSASVVLGTGPATRLARWLGGRAGEVAQPPADLPATLATVDDFRKVFEAAGLSSQDDFGEDTWSGPGVIAEWWVYPGCAALYRSGTGDQFATYFPGASSAELLAVVQVARSAS